MDFRIFDVGGQRSSRKKWIHCFDDVTGVIFVAAMSDYDLRLHEDHSINRMSESMRLFASVSNNRWFNSASMILFLNKTDIFEAKITDPDGAPLTVCFPQYEGNLRSVAEASDFVQGQFEDLYLNKRKQLYCHYTCATETNKIQLIFSDMSDMLIVQSLSDCGLY